MTDRTDVSYRIGWSPSTARWPGLAIAVAYGMLGIAMLLQPNRFNRTHVYSVLVQVVDVRIWGAAYSLVSLMFVVYLMFPARRVTSIIVHTAGFILTAWWWTAILVRYVDSVMPPGYDQAVTILPLTAWTVFLFMMVRSASLMPAVSWWRSQVRTTRHGH